MKKKKKNIRRRKLMKQIVAYTLVQIAILLYFFIAYRGTRPIDINDCTQTRIMVENVEYIGRPLVREFNVYVYSNNCEYMFPETGRSLGYPNSKLLKEIQCGDIIDIVYLERKELFGVNNLIVDARDQSEVYLDFDEYNAIKKPAFIGFCVCLGIIELLFVAVVFVQIFFIIKRF